MQNKHLFSFLGIPTYGEGRGGVKPVEPNSQLLPKICFWGSPKCARGILNIWFNWIYMSKFCRFTRFSWGKIWFERFALCWKFYILKLCHPTRCLIKRKVDRNTRYRFPAYLNPVPGKSKDRTWTKFTNVMKLEYQQTPHLKPSSPIFAFS